MTAPDLEALRAAVERNAQAVMAGNFAQIMADITPEALAQMMQMAPSGASLAQLPAITAYAITEKGPEGDGQVFEVTFDSAAGSATLLATWKPVVGQWKIVGVTVVSVTQTANES